MYLKYWCSSFCCCSYTTIYYCKSHLRSADGTYIPSCSELATNYTSEWSTCWANTSSSCPPPSIDDSGQSSSLDHILVPLRAIDTIRRPLCRWPSRSSMIYRTRVVSLCWVEFDWSRWPWWSYRSTHSNIEARHWWIYKVELLGRLAVAHPSTTE